MKIVVAGASTFGVKNAGDDAMLSVLCSGLKNKIPNLKIIFLARHPDKLYDKTFGVKSIKNIEHDSKKESIGKWFFGFNPGDTTKHLEKIKKEFEESELVILGGNSFMEVSSSDFMRGVTSYSSILATWARLFGKPFALYAVGGHPIQNEITKQSARFLCNNAKLITLREKFIKNELLKVGVSNKNLQVFADPAFGLEPISDKKKGKQIIDNETIKIKSDKIIGVCFRHMYWKWTPKMFDNYANKMAKLCDYVIKHMKSDVLFIPNCTYDVDNPYEDDRKISDHVLKKMQFKNNAHIIKKDLLLPERLAIYPHLDMVISNRRHVSIFAAIHKKPFIAISTGHLWQFEPFMDNLNVKNFLVDMTSTNANDVKNKIDYVWNHRDKISCTLEHVVPNLKKKANDQVLSIANLVKN